MSTFCGINSLLDLIGNTPLLPLSSFGSERCQISIKLESYNPGGSIKDRIALQMIQDAEEKHQLFPGDTIIEATSGNTGIALSWVGKLKGYKVKIVVHDKASKEKLRLMNYYGAEIIVTDSAAVPGSEQHFMSVAQRLSQQPNTFYCNQFNNESNPLAHYQTTAQEIWQQTNGQIDALVCGIGSAGTIMGLSRYFKEKNKKIQIIAADPQGSIFASMLNGVEYHHQPWEVEGIGSDFVPAIFSPTVVDHIYTVSDQDSFAMCRRLREREAIDVGLSTGSILAAAAIARDDHQLNLHHIVVISPDAGERYLSKNFC